MLLDEKKTHCSTPDFVYLSFNIIIINLAALVEDVEFVARWFVVSKLQEQIVYILTN